MIHRIKNGLARLGTLHRTSGWTQGCIAVNDGEFEDIWGMVNDGTTVEILPRGISQLRDPADVRRPQNYRVIMQGSR